MDVITTPADVRRIASEARRQDRTVALVPTMGFFHAGHESLMRWARAHADMVICSLFVNPTQFGPTEDLASYPRDPDRDIRVASEAGVDVLFCPDATSMYAPDHGTWIEVPELAAPLCGATRPTHFRGVCTVVAKLFHLTSPHVAVFGEKDWQQLAIIRRMVRDLDFNVEIVGRPIVREPDGLAMSSRNKYLTPQERQAAPQLHAGLLHLQHLVDAGERDAMVLARALRSWYEQHLGLGTKDYIALVHPETLAPASRLEEPTLAAVAWRLGKARLIDNLLLQPHP
ncbi:MAG: pantoate--beta-alanine ligase [Desulfovibrio sp.]|nr:pantoate--beta-alanine ligase [Desulfovibrio sp.]MCA1987412.1 pantoate--beta-alanine ligase [Desulfovibrio sp.]